MLLMIDVSGECAATGRGGIRVSNSPQPMCITPEKAAQAMLEIRARTFIPPIINAKRPHWVEYIRLLLEAQFGQEIYRAGFRVHTTLNPALQDFVEAEVKKQVEALAAQQVSDGAVIVIDPQTGYILAMMGSNDYADPKDGQINMAIRPAPTGFVHQASDVCRRLSKRMDARHCDLGRADEISGRRQPAVRTKKL